jgi:hypothetical protein
MTTTEDSQSLLLQLLDPANRANPYAAYAQIRDSGPLQASDRLKREVQPPAGRRA